MRRNVNTTRELWHICNLNPELIVYRPVAMKRNNLTYKIIGCIYKVY